MSGKYDINDDEIRILGSDDGRGKRHRGVICAVIGACIVLMAVAAAVLIRSRKSAPEVVEPYFERDTSTRVPVVSGLQKLGTEVDSSAAGFVEALDTSINDVPLLILIPHNAEASLHIGRMPSDTNIVYVSQAADIRADNGRILGAFVLKGEPRAWGLSKKGYCAIIDGDIKVGVSENSPLFEEATEKGGYFFRQYPLVDNGRICENEPKNKSLRRAVCEREGEVFMVHSQVPESFHDFAQALVDLGVDNAVYIVGGEAYGWCASEDGSLISWGIVRSRSLPKNTSYIIFRRK